MSTTETEKRFKDKFEKLKNYRLLCFLLIFAIISFFLQFSILNDNVPNWIPSALLNVKFPLALELEGIKNVFISTGLVGILFTVLLSLSHNQDHGIDLSELFKFRFPNYTSWIIIFVLLNTFCIYFSSVVDSTFSIDYAANDAESGIFGSVVDSSVSINYAINDTEGDPFDSAVDSSVVVDYKTNDTESSHTSFVKLSRISKYSGCYNLCLIVYLVAIVLIILLVLIPMCKIFLFSKEKQRKVAHDYLFAELDKYWKICESNPSFRLLGKNADDILSDIPCISLPKSENPIVKFFEKYTEKLCESKICDDDKNFISYEVRHVLREEIEQRKPKEQIRLLGCFFASQAPIWEIADEKKRENAAFVRMLILSVWLEIWDRKQGPSDLSELICTKLLLKFREAYEYRKYIIALDEAPDSHCDDPFIELSFEFFAVILSKYNVDILKDRVLADLVYYYFLKILDVELNHISEKVSRIMQLWRRNENFSMCFVSHVSQYITSIENSALIINNSGVSDKLISDFIDWFSGIVNETEILHAGK